MPELRPGDIFCTHNPMVLGRAICAAQAVWAADRKAEYSHAGIILGPQATTFEALWTNRRQGLFPAYHGRKVLIGRHEAMASDRFMDGWAAVGHLEGRWYAGHRLLLHTIPALARLGTGWFAVCSELAAKFLCGARVCDFWMGVNPDWLADLIHTPHKGWRVVYEGILPSTLEQFRGSGGLAERNLEVEACGSVSFSEGETQRTSLSPIPMPRPRKNGVRKKKRGAAARLLAWERAGVLTPATWAS